MGDIVESSEHPAGAERLMHQFKRIIAEVNAKLGDDLRSPLTITLGDEFQGIPASLGAAVRGILAVEETRIALEAHFRTRYVVHEGPVETPINTNQAHGMLGSGLTSARKRLEESKGVATPARVTVSLDDKQREELLQDALIIAMYFVDRWGEDDYPYVWRFMKGMDYKEVAESVGRDPSTAWRRERSLRIFEYTAARRIVARAAQ